MPYYYILKILHTSLNLQFTYHSEIQYVIGDIVSIELKNKIRWAIIVEITNTPVFQTKSILQKFDYSNFYALFLFFIEEYYAISHIQLLKKIITQYITKKNNKLEDNFNKKNNQDPQKNTIHFSKDQESAYTLFVSKSTYSKKLPFLLHGITGSGKTSIYIKLIENYYENKKTILYLCPNIYLANEIYYLLNKYFSQNIYCFHSQTTTAEKKIIWNKIIDEIPLIIIGVHIPILLPIKNLGFIIVDEEHDTQYANQNTPYWNTKELALLRSKAENIPILLGSATPSIQTLFQVFQKKYNYFYLQKKYHLTSPPKIIPIILKKGIKNYLSDYSKDQIDITIQNNQQILIYLNKKGFYKYAICHNCNNIFSCQNCSILLTIYEHNIASCSRCEKKIILPETCYKCNKKYTITHQGVGIEKIKKDFETAYPQKKIIIMQSEKNKKKKISQEEMQKSDIIIGTNIITQGYNFQNLALVIIINAEQNFNIPHYLIFEETIQKLIQIIGRANRFYNNGKVIIQSYNDLKQYLPFILEKNYIDFVKNELICRKKFQLPPYHKRAILMIKGKSKEYTSKVTEKIQIEIEMLINQNILFQNIKILNVDTALIKKIKNYYYWHIILSADQWKPISKLAKIILEKYNQNNQIRVNFIPNPMHPTYE